MSNKLRPIRDHIIFQFEDKSIRLNGVTHFVDETSWGFMTAHIKRGLEYPRAGTVVAVGPEVGDKVKPGDRILIEPLMWTTEIEFDLDKYWRTDLSHIVGILPEKNDESRADTE